MSYLYDLTMSMLEGSLVTLGLFAVTIVFSIPLGMLLAMAQLSRYNALKKATQVYIWIMRGTPLLLQVFFIFYGLPFIGIVFERFPSAAIAFVLNYAAYFAEIFRAGIQSIDRGQYEGADVLGLTYYQTMRRIILPQVIKRVLPPVSNETITLVKDTALVYAIGLGELLRAAKIAASRDFAIFPFVEAAVMYLLITLVLTRIFKRLEARHAYYE